MNERTKKRLLSFLQFALPAAIIGYLVWRIEPDQWEQLREQPKDFGLLGAALVVALGAIALSFARWCVLVRSQGISLSMIEAFRLGAIGFLLSFVSVGSVGGDVFKAIFLARGRPGKRVAAVASVLVDRGCGLFGLLILVAVGVSLGPQQPPDDGGIGLAQIKYIAIGLVLLGSLVLGILILGGRTVDRLITAASNWPVIGGPISTVGPPLRVFHSHPFAFGFAILMSIGVQALLVLSMFLIAIGLYEDTPTLTEHFVIVPIGMLASALPITPAGIGVLEAAMEKLYQVVPAASTKASGTLVALVFEIVKVIMAIFGTVFYWTAPDEIRQSIAQAAEENAEAAEENAEAAEETMADDGDSVAG